MLVAADFWLNSGKIHRGVEVGNVSLGGKTPAEARQIVKDHVMGPLEEIEFGGPEDFSRKASEMGVELQHRQDSESGLRRRARGERPRTPLRAPARLLRRGDDTA